MAGDGTLLLGLDVGTSGAKAGIFDAEGRHLGLGRSSYTVDSPRPGWVECDPEEWWWGVVRALLDACDDADVEPADISAVGLGVLFPAVMPLDQEGRALHPAILYCDQRSVAQVAALKEKIPEDEFLALAGNQLVPGTCAVSSLAWLRDERPDIWSATKSIGWANTYITCRLTGEVCLDPSMAALSGLVDIRDPWQWSADLCERLGIDRDLLPRIAGSAEVVGTVTESASRETAGDFRLLAGDTGLKVGTPVVAGAGDVPISAVGAGAASGDTAAYVVGSTDCVSVPMSRPSDDHRWVNCAYVPRDQWLGVGTTTSTGVSIEWFVREILGGEGSDGHALMTVLAGSAPPGSNGLLFTPYLQGERTPIWDPKARGAFTGLTRSTTRADMARAVFEGTSFALKHVMDCAESVVGEPVKHIRALGGGTKNTLWNQIKADILQTPLDVLDFQEAGCLGAALLAGMGAGGYPDLDAALAVARRTGGVTTVEPGPENAAVYESLFSTYSKIYPQTREISHELS